MSDTLRKGWLTTRDGELYAPATLVENVYTRSGKPYDERVREYIQGLQNTTNSTVANLTSKVSQHGQDIKALQGADEDLQKSLQDNIDDVNESLAQVLSKAEAAQGSVASLQSAIEDRLKNFDGSNSDKLFFIDNSNRVIAYIDNDGIHSTAVSANVFNSTDGRTELFITDNNENVIAYIDKDGVHSLNFLIQDNTGIVHNVKTVLENLQANLSNLETSMSSKIDAEAKARQEGDQALNTRLVPVEEKTENIGITANNEKDFFIVDGNEKVILRVNAAGVLSTDVKIEHKKADGTVISADLRDHEERLGTAEADLAEVDTRVTNIENGTTKVPKAIHADKANVWANKRTITLSGDVSGTANNVDGSSNISITTTVADDSHNHTEDTINLFIQADATDDDIVILSPTSNYNSVKYSGSHKQVAGTGGTHTKITYDAYGHVTSGSTPTTLAGYGITDAVSDSELADLITSRISPLEAWQDEWDEKSNVSFDENRIYFIDKNNNTIAYIDDSGLTVTNIHIKTPVVPSGSTANATGQDRSSMIFYQAKGGLISVVDTILK